MWKQVVYNNDVTNYFVNEDGNIKSGYSGKILKPLLKKDGYYECCLYINKKKVSLCIHRLVAQAFLPNPNNYKVVNHINGVKTDNGVKNLEWCSYQQNAIHAWETGLNNSSAMDKEVNQYSLFNEYIRSYKSCAEATRLTGINHIHCAAKGARKSAGGYLWKFTNDNVPLKRTGREKPVAQYDLSNNLIGKYKSISEAAKQTGINRKGINDCCNKKIKSSGGCIWKFLQEEIVQ